MHRIYWNVVRNHTTNHCRRLEMCRVFDNVVFISEVEYATSWSLCSLLFPTRNPILTITAFIHHKYDRQCAQYNIAY